MPKKPNYGFEKRKKELDRKAKQEEKQQRKRERMSHPDDAPPAEGESEPVREEQ